MSDVDDSAQLEPAAGYIRGGSAVSSAPRRILQVGLAALGLALLILIIALTVEASRHNSRAHQLSDHGVPVRVTVISCLGNATGTGITVNGYTCRGTFSYDGQQHTDVIRGLHDLRQNGAIVKGVTDPGSLGTLSTAASVRAARPSSRAYVAPIILSVVLLFGLVAFLLMSRRHPASAEKVVEPTDDEPTRVLVVPASPEVVAADAASLDPHLAVTSAAITSPNPPRDDPDPGADSDSTPAWRTYAVPGAVAAVVAVGTGFVLRRRRSSGRGE